MTAPMRMPRITRRPGRAYTAVSVVLAAAAVFSTAIGCGPAATDKASGTTSPSAKATDSFAPAPPVINAPILTSAPVARLQPGSPIMVGEGTATMVCKAGFLIDYPDPNRADQRLPGFITAAQCSRGATHAPVSVMRAQDASQPPSRIQVGEITYAASGTEQPAVTNEPWTIPTSPLAVFGSGRQDWALPVGAEINNQTTTGATVQELVPARLSRASATWSNVDGDIVTGRVLDPVETPELKNLPTGIARVVLAADNANKPIEQWVLGSPVTVDIDNAIYNLGVIVGVDETRHWVVVDLINPLLTQLDARLITAA
ncbi:hypothetical protein MMAR_3573 [Mycobacterium marinum M]|uniref:Uncharacterized protein n=2 Tax=Mycobacterium marinum TaxID=1781 RepID=B2HK47_MYCMM|nr:hypothetical protein MMAR_3573 [Mycobacterium marinum M]